MASQSPWSLQWKRIARSPIKLPNSSSSSFSSNSSVVFAYRAIHRKQTHLTAFSFEDPSSSSSPPRVCCGGHNAGKRMRKSVNKKPEKGGEEVSSVDRPRSRKRSAKLSLKSLFGRQSLWRRIVFASTKVRSIILLNVITVVYASNIPVVKEVEAIMDPAAFNVVRFAVSAIPFIPFVLQARGDAQTRNAGIELGFWVSLGYLMQALGLLTSDAGRASFISMFTVIVVPLLDGMLGSIVPARTWFGALMSVVGVAMLESSGSPPNVGDLLNFLSAIFFGIHMLRTEHISRSTAKENFLPLLGYEVCVVTISSTLWYILGAWFGDVEGGNPSSWTWTMFWDWMVVFPWIPALYTGVFSTGLCLWVEKLLPKKKEQQPLEEVAAAKRSSGLGLKCLGLVLDRRPHDMLQKEKAADESGSPAQASGSWDSLSRVRHF